MVIVSSSVKPGFYAGIKSASPIFKNILMTYIQIAQNWAFKWLLF